jgi:hypothetical protein
MADQKAAGGFRLQSVGRRDEGVGAAIVDFRWEDGVTALPPPNRRLLGRDPATRKCGAMSAPGSIVMACQLPDGCLLRAVKAILRSQWKGGFGRYPALPESTCVGVLSADFVEKVTCRADSLLIQFSQ